MVAIPFKNKTKKTKFQGLFRLDSNTYEYTIYLLPIMKQKEINEIVSYFGNRQFKGNTCLDVDEEVVASYIDDENVSAFVMVNPENVDNVASGTIQIFDWCINPPNFSSSSKSTSSKSMSIKSVSKSPNMNEADAWINDVCRISSSGNTGNPLKALFYLMEQLVSQNLQKTNIKLYITPEPENISILKPKYESLGFVKNFTDTPNICPNWKGNEIVMEKTGLVPELSVVDFSFLEGKQLSKSFSKRQNSYSVCTAKGINKRKYSRRKHKNRKYSRRK